MKISPTLSRYLASTYFANLVFLTFILMGVLYFFDVIELIRRASKLPDVSLVLVLEMALLKLPKEGQVLFPFAALYAAMYTFWQMTRRFELAVVRAAGFSVWQFLMPIVAVSMLAGVVHVTAINPLSSLLVGKYEEMEDKHLNRGENQVALFREGLWLRQKTDDGYVILHARRVDQPGWSLQSPVALFFSNDDHFLRRLDASRAQLESDRWVFENATVQKPAGAEALGHFELPTTLTRSAVEDSFSSPSAMSFWRLSTHIQTLEETGFDPTRLRVYYQSLLAQPLLFVALVLLAACVTLRAPRSQGSFQLIVVGVFLGFVFFFVSSFLQALGSSHQIPVLLAAWAPAAVGLLLGLGVMVQLEDG